jgi:hypothetical protein
MPESPTRPNPHNRAAAIAAAMGHRTDSTPATNAPGQNRVFTPLPSGSPVRNGTTFRLKVLSGDQPQAFKDLQSPAKKPDSSPSKEDADAAKHEHEPKVTLQRNGPHVTGARIECSCGQVIDLSFTLESPSPG